MKAAVIVALLFASSCVSSAQDAQPALKAAEQLLTSGKKVTDILTDPSYMPLHSLTSFREIIKKYAAQEKITLVTKNEPGTAVTINGKLMDSNSKPLGNTLVYVYHTDNKGWYSDTAPHILAREGDRGHARLFGYLRTSNNGDFSFVTIHPQGYPNSNLPQHIHFEAFAANGDALIITDFLFDDDKRLTPAVRQRFTGEGAIISSNTGTAVNQLHYYEVRTK